MRENEAGGHPARGRATGTAAADVAPAIRSFMQARQAEMVDLLCRLALAESPTDRPDVHAQVQDLLTRQLVDAGCLVDRLDGGEQGAHLLAGSRNGTDDRPTQLLVGHYDTVWPLDTIRAMPVRLENGRLSGPGVYDMKGGLVLIIYALRALEQLSLEPSVTPLVFMNSDEEIGSPTSTSHIERLARSADRALILEPAQGPSGKIKTARKGVGHFKIRIRGVAAHAGVEPEQGASAVLELAYLVQRLHALNDPERGISVNVGVISGGNRSNVVAADSLAKVDIRAYHETEAMEIRDAVLAIEPVTPGVRDRDGRLGFPAGDGAHAPKPCPVGGHAAYRKIGRPSSWRKQPWVADPTGTRRACIRLPSTGSGRSARARTPPTSTWRRTACRRGRLSSPF